MIIPDIPIFDIIENNILDRDNRRTYVKSFIYDKISPLKEIIENQARKRNQELLEKEKIRKEALNSIFSNRNPMRNSSS